MSFFRLAQVRLAIALIALVTIVTGCSVSAKDSVYFGKVIPPQGQVMRYVTGSESETLDPQVGTSAPDARIYGALYEGLVEYDPKNTLPIPAIAEKWEVNSDSSELVFHLRTNARWSNGEPITAKDFVYTFQRGLSPKLASRNAYLAYYIKYSQGYNTGGSFVRDPKTGEFVLEEDVLAGDGASQRPGGTETPKVQPGVSPTYTVQPGDSLWRIAQNKLADGNRYMEILNANRNKLRSPQSVIHPGDELNIPQEKTQESPSVRTSTIAAPSITTSTTEDSKPNTPLHEFMHSPTRLVLSGEDSEREAQLAANPKIKDAIAGKEMVPVLAQDMGVEAIDDYTLRITLRQSAPFFLGLLAHQFFRAVPQKTIEKHGEAWTKAENIVSSGAFKLKEWIPYDRLVVEKNPTYWDASVVQLRQLTFYPVKDSTTIMNLYKAGEIDAFLNHNVPHGWLDVIRPLRDYMDAVENANDYYDFNVRRGPFMDKRLRKAFNFAIDKEAFARWRKTVKPLTGFVPTGIFPGYPNPKGDSFNPERARQLMAEAGYPVTKGADGKFVCKNFPIDQVEITYNPDGMNTPIAEFLQAQWKQNLGVTLPLKSMEFRTFLNLRAKGDFKGIARDAWGGDYMDPFTFLNLFYAGAENGSGWHDPKYDAMLDEANRQSDPKKRFELFAKAEAYMLEEQPVIPLDTPTVNNMKKPYVKGMYPNPLTLHAWKYVYIEYDQAKWDQGTPNMAE